MVTRNPSRRAQSLRLQTAHCTAHSTVTLGDLGSYPRPS